MVFILKKQIGNLSFFSIKYCYENLNRNAIPKND